MCQKLKRTQQVFDALLNDTYEWYHAEPDAAQWTMPQLPAYT